MSNKPTFNEFLRDNQATIWRKSSDKHRGEALSRCHKFAEFRGYGDIGLHEFKRNDLHVYMDHLVTNKGFSEATANRHLVAVSAVFKAAYQEELITRPLRAELYKEDRHRMRVFSDTEVAKIIRLLRSSDTPWMADMAILSLNTGMRLGEIVKVITGEAELEIDDDGFRWIFLKKTKNGDPRYVPLNEGSRAAYERLRAINWPFNWVSLQKAFYRTWNSVRKKVAPRDKEFVFHVFRHTAATKMANDLNLNSAVIALMLGHRDTATTAKYIKIKTATMKEVARQMKQA